MNETELIKLAKAGNQQAMEKLYSLSFRSLYKYIRFKVDNTELAEDITAEAYTRAFENILNFKEKSSFKTYVYTIAKNLLYESYRANTKTQRIDEYIEATASTKDDFTDEPANSDETTIKVVEKMLEVLSEKERAVIELRYLSNFDVKETAESLQLSESNVKVITHRALEKCREKFVRSN